MPKWLEYVYVAMCLFFWGLVLAVQVLAVPALVVLVVWAAVKYLCS